MSRIIGIDLGTTNSAVAHMTSQGPRLIPNAIGSNLTPSVVAVDLTGNLLVGAAAKEMRVTHPELTASLFKRHMGTDWTTTLGTKSFGPEELSSLVLKSLRADAESHFGEEVTRAVISVPAYFNDRQRNATMAAGKIAGLTVERIINEPTAAAIAYGLHDTNAEKKLLIFDLGGGTFDVSIVDLFEGTMEVKASSGVAILGGEDFTRTLAARVLERTGSSFERAEMNSPRQVSRLIQLCEVAKLRLSKDESTPVRIPNPNGELDASSQQVTVTRKEYQEWIDHILARIEMPVRRVLSDANLARADLDDIILVGGSTRTPVVVERVTAMFGKPPRRTLNPDEVVAMGAAVQAGLFARDEALEDVVVTDVAPFTLGVEVSKKFGNKFHSGYFSPVIERNTTIPISRSEIYTTCEANQTEMLLKIYQGEHRRTEENLFLDQLTVKGIPKGPAGQEILVRFTYDLNGLLEVEATVVETKKMISAVITSLTKGKMSEKQIAESQKEMEKLKLNPREDSKNRYLIKRAERLYEELGLQERTHLGELLDGFEESLASQDPEVIERYRKTLAAYLDHFDPEHEDE
jgi:molecular chaperone HscC